MNKRYEELDSLRGLAALIVVFYHMKMIIPQESFFWRFIGHTPFRILFAGNESVILFFVLSGFALTLMFSQQKQIISYPSFLLRRIGRIHFPYVVAISIAIISSIFVSKGGIKGLSGWFNTQWVSNLDVSLILNHYLLIGNFNVYSYNVVLWSLIHEMRISIIFPLLMLMVGKFNWKINIIIGIFLGLIGGALHLYFKDPYQSLYKTLPYILMFLVGILLAKNIKTISAKYDKLKLSYRLTILIFGILVYSYSFLLKNQIFVNWSVTIGATIIIVSALFSRRFSKLLLISPFKLLGKISYSLYLYHVPVLLSFIYVLYGTVPIWLIFVISFIASIVVSCVAWKYVELPCNKLGKKLAHKVETSHRIKSIEQVTQTH